MPEPYLAEIAAVPYDIAPKGWATCDGQILPINQNQALFSLLGTTYGGNGQTTFALPDLRGRVPLHMGAGPDLPEAVLGEASGGDNVQPAPSDGSAPKTTPTLAVNWIIALIGVFPSRN